jgi:hypothetical protein
MAGCKDCANSRFGNDTTIKCLVKPYDYERQAQREVVAWLHRTEDPLTAEGCPSYRIEKHDRRAFRTRLREVSRSARVVGG